MVRTLKCGKLLRSTVLGCCFFFNFTQFLILENLSVLDLTLSGVKGLRNECHFLFTVIFV